MLKTVVPVLAAGMVLVLLAAAFLLSSGPTGDQTSQGVCAAASGVPSPSPTGSGSVDGYRGDQLVNARTIVAAGTQLHVPTAGLAIGVMTAMGESGLRDLTYGDAAGPDSRGLFQQRDNWGPLAARLDPRTAATLFFRRLLAVPAWKDLQPTQAAHAVQGNADPDYYTPFYKPALDVLAAIGASPACAADLVPAPDAQALAQQLVGGIRAGTITGLVPDHLHEVQWIAAGRSVPDCGVDVRILQILVIAWHLFHRIGVGDINRRCTGQIAGAGVESSHWIDGGGHAVDLFSLGGTPTTGADSNAIRLIDTLDPLVPNGARIGQAECRTADSDAPRLTHFTTFDDTCNHLHIDVAFTSGRLGVPQPTPSDAP